MPLARFDRSGKRRTASAGPVNGASSRHQVAALLALSVCVAAIILMSTGPARAATVATTSSSSSADAAPVVGLAAPADAGDPADPADADTAPASGPATDPGSDTASPPPSSPDSPTDQSTPAPTTPAQSTPAPPAPTTSAPSTQPSAASSTAANGTVDNKSDQDASTMPGSFLPFSDAGQSGAAVPSNGFDATFVDNGTLPTTGVPLEQLLAIAAFMLLGGAVLIGLTLGLGATGRRTRLH